MEDKGKLQETPSLDKENEQGDKKPVKKVKVVKKVRRVKKKPVEESKGLDTARTSDGGVGKKKVKRVVRKVPKADKSDLDQDQDGVVGGELVSDQVMTKSSDLVESELELEGGVDTQDLTTSGELVESEVSGKKSKFSIFKNKKENTELSTGDVDDKSLAGSGSKVGSFLLYILELILISLFVIVVSSLINKYVVTFNIVSGSSMNPTLKDGDVCSVVKPKFSGDIERGDIISFRIGDESDSYVYVKRVVGLPGDRVNVYDGVIHINGEPLEEDYIQEGLKTDNPEKLYWELGLNEYFVLGDNRKPGMSHDSRHFGSVHYSMIEGKLGMIVMPFERQQRLNK